MTRTNLRDLRSRFTWQWPVGACLLMALLLTSLSFLLRVADAADPRIEDESLGRAVLGVYADIDTIVAMQYRPIVDYATTPDQRWDIEMEPGTNVRVRATLLLLSGGSYYRLDVDEPLTIVAAFPPEARWDTNRSEVMPDGKNCASWYDGKTVRVAHPEIVEAYDESVAFICRVPAVGRVQQLAFDFRASFPDHVRESFGFGRTQSGIRMSAAWVPDANLADQSLNYMLRQSADVKLDLPSGVQLIESFPEPTGGTAATREWRVGDEAAGDIHGEDITFRLEEPRRRVWVQPLIDLSLLGAGVLFGLAPSLRRAKRSTARSGQPA